MEGSAMHGTWMFCLESQHFIHLTTRMLKKKFFSQVLLAIIRFISVALCPAIMDLYW